MFKKHRNNSPLLLTFCIYILICLFVPISFKAQNLDFNIFSLEKGLGQSEVNDIVEDRFGYIWVATNGGGVSKFDGYKFINIEEKDGLAGNIVRSITIDKKGYLWCGSSWGGISRYDGRIFKKFNESTGLKANDIYLLKATKDDLLFVAYKVGVSVYRINREKNSLDFYRGNNQIKASDFTEDKNGNVFIATDKGLYLFSEDKFLSVYTNDDRLKTPLNLVYFNNSSVFVCDENNKIFETKFNEKNPAKIESINELPALSENEIIQDLIKDKIGNVWITTFSNIYKFKNNIYEKISIENGLPAVSLKKIIQDVNDNFWIGALGKGLIKLNNHEFSYFEKSLEGKEVQPAGITEDFTDGTIYVGNRAEGILALKDNVLKTIISKETLGNRNGIRLLKWNTITLVATNKGLFQYDGKLEKPSFWQDSLSESYISNLFIDSKNNLWVSTRDVGAFKITPELVVTPYIMKADKGYNKNIWCFAENNKGDIAIGSSAGLIIVKNDEITYYDGDKNKFCNTYVSGITSDQFGRFWFGTDQCVILFDGETFKNIGIKEGLKSGTIYCINSDVENHIYVGSNKGLDKISLDSKGEISSIKNYSYDQGFKGIECNARSILTDRSGNMWFGTIKGLIKLNPQNSKTPSLPNVQLIDIEIKNKIIDWDSLQTRTGWFNIPDNNYEFKYDDNYLTFKYESVNPAYPFSVKYSFFLKGFENNWNYVEGQRLASYSNLNNGDYELHVRASYDGINFGEEYVYKFSIATPWWKKAWFLSIMFLVFAGFIFQISRYLLKYKSGALKNFIDDKSSIITSRLILVSACIIYAIGTYSVYLHYPNLEVYYPLTISFIIFGFILYLLSFINKFIIKHIHGIVFILFWQATLYLSYLVYVNNLDLVLFGILVISGSPVSLIFKTMKGYLLWAVVFLVLNSILAFYLKAPLTNPFYYISINMLFVCIGTIIMVAKLNINNKLLFSSVVLDKTNTFVLATNKKNELVFTNENTDKILGETKIYNANTATTNNSSEITETVRFGNSNTEKIIEWKGTEISSDLFVNVGQDVTDKYEERKRYEQLVEQSNDVIYTSDEFGRFLYLNKKIFNFLGYEPSELIGKRFTSIMRKDYRHSLQMFYLDILKSNTLNSYKEFPVTKKDGTSIWIAQKAVLRYKDQTQKFPIGFQCTVSDITDRKIAQEELEKIRSTEADYNSRLELLNNIKDQLINSSTISQVTEKTFGFIRNKINNCSQFSLLLFNNDNATGIQYYNSEKGISSKNFFLTELRSMPLLFKKKNFYEPNLSEVKNFSESDKENLAAGTKSYIAYPLIAQNNVIGAFYFDFDIVDPLSENLNLFLNQLCATVAQGIEQIKSQEKIRNINKALQKSLVYTKDILTDLELNKQKLTQQSELLETLNSIKDEILDANTFNHLVTKTHQLLKNKIPELLITSILVFEGEDDKEDNINFYTEHEIQQIKDFENENKDWVLKKSDLKSYEALKNNKSVIEHDLVNAANLSSSDRLEIQYGVKSNIGIPLTINNRVNGALYLSFKSKDIIDSKLNHFLDEISNSIAIGVERISYRNKIEEQSINLDIQNSIKDKILNSNNLNDLIENIFSFIRIKIPHCLRSTIVFRKENDPSYAIIYFNSDIGKTYYNINQNKEFEEVNVSDFKSLHSIFEGTIFIENNIMEAANLSESDKMEIKEGVRGYLGMPLKINGENTAAFYLAFDKANVISKKTVDLLKGIIDTIAIGIDQLSNKKIIEKQAYMLNVSNTIKDKVLDSESIDDLAEKAIRFYKDIVAHCNHVGMSIFNEAAQNSKLFYIENDTFTSRTRLISSLKTYHDIKQGKDYIEEDLFAIEKKSEVDNILLSIGVVAYCTVPILLKNEVIGSFNIGFSKTRQITAELLEVLHETASILAIGVEQILSKETINNQSKLLNLLNDAKDFILDSTSLDDLAERSIHFYTTEIEHCVNADLFIISDKEEDCTIYSKENNQLKKERHKIALLKTYDTIKTGEIYIEEDLSKAEVVSPSDEMAMAKGVIAYMMTPIISKGKLIGSFNIGFGTTGHITERLKVALLETAESIAIGIEKIKAQDKVKEINKDMTDSLEYSRYIQRAILPDSNFARQLFKDCFIYYQPKDIIGGDFYWMDLKDEKIFLAVGDCTGHGVPGALLSIMGYNILNQSVRERHIKSPGQILKFLQIGLSHILNKNETSINDGMDIGICSIDLRNKKLSFSSAKMSLLIVRANNIIEIKGENFSIEASNTNMMKHFEDIEFDLETGDKIYAFSDGMVDQFGGPNQKRFLKKQLKDLLEGIYNKNMQEQKESIEEIISIWKGKNNQTDDMTLIGFEV
jgi:PAS domain S-box-containing protein